MVGNFLVSYVLNLGFVAAWMAIFFAPFVIVFYIRNRQQIREKKPHFNYFMERFFASPESNYLVFAWAMLEAVVWFIIPEFLLFLMIFMKIRRKANLLGYDIAGTVAGTILGYIFHASTGQLLGIPYVFTGMITQTRGWYSHYGIWGVLWQPFSGVPYKVFTALAPEFHFFILGFLVVAILARISRYLVAYILTQAIYPFLHQFVRKHYAILFTLAIMIFTLLLMRVSGIYGVPPFM